MDTLDTSKIVQVPLKESNYIQRIVAKTQVVLHHTAGNSSGINTAKAWDADDRGRIATAFVISGKGVSKNSVDGEIVQCFSSKYAAYHLGVKGEVFKSRRLPWRALDELSVGIEICNWGPLEKIGEKYFNYVDREVDATQVCVLDTPYKGVKYYHVYTDAQIESVRQLLVYLKNIYSIDLTYKEDQMWAVSNKALSGDNGVYTHNSYRKDKNDISPQPKLIAMLKTL